MITRRYKSEAWLLWTGLFLLGLVALVMLGSGFETSQALAPLNGVEVNKTVNMPSAVPGQAPAPLYTVTFTNSSGADVVLEAITDTLPPGFVFVDMHPLSDWLERPDDEEEPEIVWQGPITIPAAGTLSLVYAVDTFGVPPSATPYENRVEAVTAGGTPIGPASAKIRLGQANVDVQKEAWPTRVLHSELVTYTVVFANSGHLTGTLDLISDTLDPSLTFAGMAAGSDVMDEPDEVVPGTLTWAGPFEVPLLGALTLRYQAQAPAGSTWSYVYNQVEAATEGQVVGPASTRVLVGPEKGYYYIPAVTKDFRYAYLALTKSAFPTTVTTNPGQVVTYTVTIENEGDTTGTLLTVYDILPTGFTFLKMAAGSDIQADPTLVAGKLTWTLAPPIVMPPGSQKRVIYQVSPSQVEGQYTNHVGVTAEGAAVQDELASATITVEPGILLQDNFNSGIAAWTPFLNYWRLEEGQWYWGQGEGYAGSGALSHDCMISKKIAHDALMMYLGPGAEEWTDYRVETRLLLRGGVSDEGDFEADGGYPVGLWVRGQYEESETRGQWVTGYYVVVGGKPQNDTFYVRLAQLQTLTDCWGAACDNPQNLYNFNNPHELITNKLNGSFKRYQWYTLAVEVHGDRIKVWFDGQLAIDYTDSKEPFLTGTVGFKTYKSKTVSFDDIIVTPLND